MVTNPENWAPINSTADCSAVVGMYRENGERGPGGSRGGFLRFTYLATFNEVDFWGPLVTLSFPESDVFPIKAGGERGLSFNAGEATCSDGKIELRRSFLVKEIVGPAWFYDKVTLAKSTDGWLVAEFGSTQWAFVGFIPTYSRFDDWYSLEPFKLESGPK